MNTTDITEAANACIATRVHRLSRLVTRVYDEAMRPLGITGHQYILLAQIATRDEISCIDMVVEMDIDKSTLSRNLKRLITMGFVTMGPHRGRYPRILGITASGKYLLEKALSQWQDAQSRTLDAMSAESGSLLDLLLAKAERIRPVVFTKRKAVV